MKFGNSGQNLFKKLRASYASILKEKRMVDIDAIQTHYTAPINEALKKYQKDLIMRINDIKEEVRQNYNCEHDAEWLAEAALQKKVAKRDAEWNRLLHETEAKFEAQRQEAADFETYLHSAEFARKKAHSDRMRQMVALKSYKMHHMYIDLAAAENRFIAPEDVEEHAAAAYDNPTSFNRPIEEIAFLRGERMRFVAAHEARVVHEIAAHFDDAL